MAVVTLGAAPATAAVQPATNVKKTGGLPPAGKTAQTMRAAKPGKAAQFAQSAKSVKAVKLSKAPQTANKASKAAKASKQTAAPVASVPVVTDEPDLMPEQLAVAERVMVGSAACEFGQTILLTADPAKRGHFVLASGPARYALVPYETATGAVRLEDRKQGVVWLQIPSKSMLLSERLGQRLVDNCLHELQRGAVVSSANGLGIAEPLLAPANQSVVLVAQAVGDVLAAAVVAVAPNDLPNVADASDLGDWPWTLAAQWPATPALALAGWMDMWAPPFDLVAWAPVGTATVQVGNVDARDAGISGTSGTSDASRTASAASPAGHVRSHAGNQVRRQLIARR